MRNRDYSPREIDSILANRRYSRRGLLADVHEVMESNETFQEIASIAESHGYQLDYALIRYGEPKIVFRDTIGQKYKPQIRYSTGRFGEPKGFYADTVSYGDTMTVDKYKIFAKNVLEAYKMLEELESVDLSGLYEED